MTTESTVGPVGPSDLKVRQPATVNADINRQNTERDSRVTREPAGRPLGLCRTLAVRRGGSDITQSPKGAPVPHDIDFTSVGPIAAQALTEAAARERSAGGRDPAGYNSALNLLGSLPPDVQRAAVISVSRIAAAAVDELSRRSTRTPGEILCQLHAAQEARP